MGFFRRTPPIEEHEYVSPALEVHEAEPPPPPRVPLQFPPKPEELVRAADWTRPAATRTTSPLPWTTEPPGEPGYYWWREQDTAEVHSAVVLRFGGTLCVRQRRGDAAMYVSVAALRRAWSGPTSIPADVHLEQLESA